MTKVTTFRGGRGAGWTLLCAAAFQMIPAAWADTKDTGEILNVLLPASALYATIFHEENNEGTVQFIKSAVVAELVTESLKQLVDKERPTGSCCTAFPSGHATRAFYSAAFLDRRYGKRVGLPAYALATIVAYSRVDSDQHDEVDVLGGALVGWLSSRYFTTPYKGVSVTPVADPEFVGVTVRVDF